MKNFDTFSQLHYSETPLLIGNVWDVNSARIFEGLGFKAIATSSHAVAVSMGYEDGQNMPFEMLLNLVKQIKKAISIPLSVDMERGYADNIPGIIQNMQQLYDAGVAGVNIEDSLEGSKLRSIESFQKIISAISEWSAKEHAPLFINARTDAYLTKQNNPLRETLARVKAYEAAGADGVFIPFITEITEIEKIVNATSLPVSVFFTKQLSGIKQLSDAGIRRISMGAGLYKYLNNRMTETVSVIVKDGTAEELFR